MKSFARPLTPLLFAVAASLAAAPATAASIPNELEWAQGTNWSHRANFLGFPEAWVYVPDSFTERAPDRRGLVFHLIGCGQVPFQAAQAAGWPEAAEAHGLVVVVPGPAAPVNPNRDAPQVECFNYGYDGAFGVYVPRRGDPDQAAVIAAARAMSRDAAFAEMAIDPNQVYVAGLSAGGALAVEVACMAPDVFAGVATASAPGIATSQGTAVMPPPFGYGPDTVIRQCQQWADQSGAPDARAQLGSQVMAIVSDNNGLPAGLGPLDTSKFNNQQIWDGDKFCPHVYQENRASAFAEILGLEQVGEGVELGRGEGIGCPGGEASVDDGGEVSCVINDFVRREWVARADVWADAEGNTRLVQIEQDTLRHAWPSGPIGFADNPDGATPTRAELRDAELIVEATGEFDRNRMGFAQNGQYGVIYFNHDAIDFPMYVAGLWSHNNPRLPRHQPPAFEAVAADDSVDANGAGQIDIAGRVVAWGESSIAGITLTLHDEAGSVVAGFEAPVDGSGDVAFDVHFPGLEDGRYRVNLRAVDDTGAVSETSVGVTVGEVAGVPPTVSLDAAASAGAGCLSIGGAANDDDGVVETVELTVLGIGTRVARAVEGRWEQRVCDLAPGSYPVFAVAVDDVGDRSPPTPITRVTVRGGATESASGDLTVHSNAGRIVRFTPEYFEYRERYCEQVFFAWQCEPFNLYRCEADAPWSDAEPDCGGEAGDAAIAIEAATRRVAIVGDEVAFAIVVRNEGPDDAAAAYVLDPLPRALRFVGGDDRCGLIGGTVICHLGDLAAGEATNIELLAEAIGGGAVVNQPRAGSANSPEVSTEVPVQIGGGEDVDDEVDPWSGIDGGEIDPGDGEPDAGEAEVVGCAVTPGHASGPWLPVALAGLFIALVGRRRLR